MSLFRNIISTLISPSGAGRGVEARNLPDALGALPLIVSSSEQSVATTSRLQAQINTGLCILTYGVYQISSPLILTNNCKVIIEKGATIKAATGFSGVGVSVKACSGVISTAGTGYLAGDLIVNAAGTWVAYTVSGGAVTSAYPLISTAMLNPTTGALTQTSTATITNGNQVTGAGTGCKITPTYTASALLLGGANSTTNTGALKGVIIGGDGILDGNMLCNRAIDIPYGQDVRIYDLHTTRCLLGGVVGGSDVLAPASAGICTNRMQIWYNDSGPSDYTYPPNSPTSIGVHHINNTDNDLDKVTVVGYRTGFKTELTAGPDRLTACHAWTRNSHGPLSACFDMGATGDKLVFCDADTPTNLSQGITDTTVPTVYGFRTRRFDTVFNSCRLYLNPTVGVDNTAVGYQIDQFGSNTRILFPEFICATGLKIQAQYGGQYIQPQVTIFGDISDGQTYGSTATKYQRIGGYAVHCMVTWAFDNVSAGYPCITGLAGTNRDMIWQTNNANRWNARVTSTAESGSNVGSDFILQPYSDTATALTTALTITRADNTATFGGKIVGNSGLIITPPTVSPASDPGAVGQMTFEATSNTSVRIRFKGSDGIIRSATLTLS